MSETKFTPGPWVRSSHGFQVLTNDRRTFIAQTHTKDNSPATEEAADREERVANADLIAAAPELLKALAVAAEDLCSLRCPSVKKTGTEWTHVPECMACQAALAKARGEG